MKKEYNLDRLKKRKGTVKTALEAAKVSVSLRLDACVLAQIKTEAERVGLPYQTLINSILHQYTCGELVDKRLVDVISKFLPGK